jgi:hypothetical protein
VSRLGQRIVVLATATAGGFVFVYGRTIPYKVTFETDLNDPSVTLNRSLPFVMFLVHLATGGIGQCVNSDLRYRLRH